MMLPIDALTASPLNPRGPVLEDDDLRDLATSLKSHGLIQALTVREARPGAGIYEVVCGHRRLAAARLAGLRELECKVLVISDAQALEIMLVENSARRDVPPLQEADALATLVKMGQDPAALADRLGHSRKWVRDRLALGRLDEACRRALDEGQIGLRSAVALALLPEETMAKVGEHLQMRLEAGPTTHDTVLNLISMENHALTTAPWGALESLGGRRACARCPSRSDAQPDLWEGRWQRGAYCLDGACWRAKMDALAEGAERVKGYVDKAGRAAGVNRCSQLLDGSTTLAQVLPATLPRKIYDGGVVMVDRQAAASHLRSIGFEDDALAIEDEGRLWQPQPRQAEAKADAARKASKAALDAALVELGEAQERALAGRSYGPGYAHGELELMPGGGHEGRSYLSIRLLAKAAMQSFGSHAVSQLCARHEGATPEQLLREQPACVLVELLCEASVRTADWKGALEASDPMILLMHQLGVQRPEHLKVEGP
jgi:ParB/RepB/Spo0J family partition protein